MVFNLCKWPALPVLTFRQEDLGDTEGVWEHALAKRLPHHHSPRRAALLLWGLRWIQVLRGHARPGPQRLGISSPDEAF